MVKKVFNYLNSTENKKNMHSTCFIANELRFYPDYTRDGGAVQIIGRSNHLNMCTFFNSLNQIISKATFDPTSKMTLNIKTYNYK